MSTEEHKNVSYYDALATNYDLFFCNLGGNMEQEGEWLSSVLHAHGANKVLDASCGTGRQAIPLSQRGFAVTAADPSLAMLREAETMARERGVQFPVLNAGFADLSSHFQGDFDAVIALGNGLCNLDEVNDIEKSLHSMYACCRPGGICLIGIKDFAAIVRDRERFHGHRVVDRNEARTILFEIWDFQDPTLISTAYLVNQPHDGEPPTIQSAQTREHMLREDELRDLAGAVNFRAVHRLDHPSEAAFVLLK